MSTPPETAPSTPSLTPQERLDALQEEIQNARNAPPITPDRRTALQNSLDDLRANTSIDQAELNRLDQEILSLPTPPPAPDSSVEDAVSVLPPEQQEQARQAIGFFKNLKSKIFKILGAIPFLRKWAQGYLKEMGMDEYADELRSPDEKKKAEDEKRKQEEDERKKKFAREHPEHAQVTAENLEERQKKAYAFALVKAFNDAAGSEIVPTAENANEHSLDYARRIGTALAEALMAEKFQDTLALELDPHLEATDTTSASTAGAIFSLGIADYDIPGMKDFGTLLKTDPKSAFEKFKTIDTSPLDITSRKKIDTIQASLMAAERTMTRDIRPAPAPIQNPVPTPPTPPVT